MIYHKMGMSNFPVLDKVKANGGKTASFYKFLKAHKNHAEGPVGKHSASPGDLSWNYEKFLVDENGQVLGRYTSRFDVKHLESRIQNILGDSDSPNAGRSKMERSLLLLLPLLLLLLLLHLFRRMLSQSRAK